MDGGRGKEGAYTGGGFACPRCGRPLEVSLLEVAADDGDEPETLVLLDCPNGDFRGTVTRERLLERFTAEVMARLR